MSTKLSTLFDNRGDNTVLAALRRLLPATKNLDVATGTFEVGSFLALEEQWKTLEKLRIVMGDEATRRTKNEIINALEKMSVDSIESEKERDDNLTGLAAVREAISNKKIAIRIYAKAKFHAKAYIFDAHKESPVDFSISIVGSSNFTRPGLTQNLELNLFTTDKTHIGALREWYEAVWKEAEDASAEKFGGRIWGQVLKYKKLPFQDATPNTTLPFQDATPNTTRPQIRTPNTTLRFLCRSFDIRTSD